MQYLLAIDQGTTSSRAVIVTPQGEFLAQHQIEFAQHFPHDGWVEHNPEDIWQSTLSCCQRAIQQSGVDIKHIAGLGISNQRETTVVWRRDTGEPIYPAIVWQDRRTSDQCASMKLQQPELEGELQKKTGLLLDPYFSATKVAWILDHVTGARELAEQGQLAFGTIDTFLIWRLTGGKRHVTDVTNASRTLLFNIHDLSWDKTLLQQFSIPESMLPEVLSCDAHFGDMTDDLLGAPIPIHGVVGDQQAAAIGQACFSAGMAKATFGTGCFILLNTGKNVIQSRAKLLSTVAYQIQGQTTYALEGSIFNAGTTIKWLRDQLGLIESARDTETLARSVDDTNGVYFVPSFTGIGAPFWDPHARGAILGLTRDAQKAHIVRAALESVCYRVCDLIEAMRQDNAELTSIRVDGGMAANNWLLQFLADIINVGVERPNVIETSVLGAAMVAAIGTKIYASLDQVGQLWRRQQQFEPNISAQTRQHLYQHWLTAVTRVLAK